MERFGRIEWRGDLGSEYQLPISDSPFLRGAFLKGNETLCDLVDSGGRRHHTCVQGRMPWNVVFQPFVLDRTNKPEGGMTRYDAYIRVTMVGMVEQNTPGRWQWVGYQEFSLPIPLPFRKILGEWLRVDGWFLFMGEKASRGKGKKMIFIPKDSRKMRKCVPKGTRLRLFWDEFLLPAPCVGVTLWAAYASLIDLKWSGR